MNTASNEPTQYDSIWSCVKFEIIIYYLLPNIGRTSTHSVSFGEYPSIISQIQILYINHGQYLLYIESTL